VIIVVFVLCVATSLLCAVLLLRGWLRTRVALLLQCQGLSHGLRLVERAQHIDSETFSVLAQVPTALGVVVLLWGLVHAE
jgi:hypothetical protein